MPRYAAVDIGSNSVRMMVADANDGEFRVLTQERQVTRLGESVFRDGAVSAEALAMVCGILAQMAAAYKRFDVHGIRAVATSAIRDTRNQVEFLTKTSAALGTNVEIISGAEEARLIYLGVETLWPRAKERTLIVDVGGGSAELIVTEEGKLVEAISRPLGAVRLTEVFLQTDPPTAVELHRLDRYIEEKLAPFQKRFGDTKFDRVVATSATAAAIVCVINQVPRLKRDTADRLRARTSQVRQLYLDLIRRDLTARRKVLGIGPRRAEIITAGTAVFLRVLELFHHSSLYYCNAGVRDGIIADLAARGVGLEISQLSREQRAIVENVAKRYGVVMKHARRVAALAHRLFDSLQSLHNLAPSAGKLLEAACYLHDTGHFISGTGHHKHSYYVVANSDMPGFTDSEREIVASLCRFHRKSMPQPRHSQFQALDPESKRLVITLAPLLRLADALDRGHNQKVKDVSVTFDNKILHLRLDVDGEADLETWAATEASEVFTDIFGVQVIVDRARG